MSKDSCWTQDTTHGLIEGTFSQNEVLPAALCKVWISEDQKAANIC